MNNRNSLLALVCALVFVLASCLAPVGIEPGGKVNSERYETIDLQTRGMEYKVKTPAQWQIIMRLINIKSANALRAAQAAESEENVPQAASSADTQTIAPVYTMILGAGANITLPSSGAELNPPLTTEGVTLIVKGEDSDNPSTLILGDHGTLLDIGANRTLILENVIVRGKAGNTGGPLIKVQGGALELREGTVITGNTRTGGSGGGIFLDGGSLLAGQGTKITGNTASGTNGKGGGIYAQGNASLTVAGVIGGGLPGEGNNAGGDGGGIYLSGGAVIALEDGSEIVGNTAGNGGGGIYFNGGTHEIGAGVKISGNSASGGSGKGGGVYANNAVLTLEGIIGGTSQSEGNTAKIQGGGIYLSGGRLTLEDGAAVNWNTTTNTAFDANWPYGGGGVYADGTTLIMNGSSAVSNNSLGDYSRGGGIYLKNKNLTMNGSSVISDNAGTVGPASANSGGGIYLMGSNLFMNGSSAISRNQPNCGIYCGGTAPSNITMKGSSVVGGIDPSDGNAGNGIHLIDMSHTLVMEENAAIANNSNCGVYTFIPATSNQIAITMKGSSVIRNNGSNGIHALLTTITMKDNSKIGGALGHGNTAARDGGGVYLSALYHGTRTSLSIYDNAVISHNHSSGKGGGVYVGLTTNFTVGTGKVFGNTAGQGDDIYRP